MRNTGKLHQKCKVIVRYWNTLTKATKKVFILWTIISFYMLFSEEPKYYVWQWALVWIFGSFIYCGIAQIVTAKSFSDKNNNYQDNFKEDIFLDESQEILDNTKADNFEYDPIFDIDYLSDDSKYLIQKELEKPNKHIISQRLITSDPENLEEIENKKIYTVDPYFLGAGKFIIEKGTASIGMLQRVFAIGFNRADKIMDQLYEFGVVGPEEGIKPRTVLMSIEEFEYILESNIVIFTENTTDTSQKCGYSDFNVDRFARECNAYLEKEERCNEQNYIIEPNIKNTVISNEESDIKLKGNVDKPENNFDSMSGHEFERFFASILEKNGFYNVEVTPGSGDHGIDVLAEKDDITYAFQCKCYSKDIGNSAVQQAHTGKSIYKTDIAVVITNREFTPQAKEEAEILGVKLWDRNKLIELINNQK